VPKQENSSHDLDSAWICESLSRTPWCSVWKMSESGAPGSADARPEGWLAARLRRDARKAQALLHGGGTQLGFSFVDVARKRLMQNDLWREHKNRYLLETTGCGVAFYDFDHDDWIDVFLVNGTGWKDFRKVASDQPLFKNNRDGTFTDITAKSGMVRSGWGRDAASRL